jgi:hypothetical protein
MIQYPGKFEGELYATRAVWDMAGDHGVDEELGSTDELGWFCKYSGTIRGRGPFHVIVSEDSQGFVHGEYFDTESEMIEAWAQIETEYNCFYTEQEGQS